MNRLRFSIDINAPRSRVWQALWDDPSYRDWTSVFSPGSHAVSDWREGSRIQFLDGEGRGMDSVIDKSVANEFMSFRHVGEIQDGKVRPFDDRMGDWSGGHENYTLTERNTVTTVTVDLDAPLEYADMFNDKFPQALQRLKEVAEEETAKPR